MSERRNITSIAQYAKDKGVTEQAIREQIGKGLIKRVARGYIDADQANAAWARIRRSRITVQQDDPGRRSAESKIVAAFAKLRLAKDRLEATRERYLPRPEAIAQVSWESEAFIAWLEEMPTRRADELAQMLNLEPDVAKDLLERFIRLVIAEIGDLKDEAVKAAEAA